MYTIKIDSICSRSYSTYAEALHAFRYLPSNPGRYAELLHNGRRIYSKML